MGKLGRPPVPARRRLRPTLGLAAVVGLVLVGWVVLRDAGPTYRGRSARYYFPAWVSPSARGTGRTDRFPEDAGAEAVPFLIQVLQLRESKFHRSLMDAWGRIPGDVRKVLPEPVSIHDTWSQAFPYLMAVTSHPEGMAEVTRRFDEVPDFCRVQLLYHFANQPALAKYTLPVFRSILRGSDAQPRRAAATSVLILGEAGLPLFPELLACLEEAQRRGGETDIQWETWCLRLPRLGTTARQALPLLERLREHPSLKVRLGAGLAIAELEDDPLAVERTFEREVVPQGARAFLAFTETLRLLARNAPGRLQTTETLPIWGSLLSASQLSNWFSAPIVAPANRIPSGEPLTSMIREIRLRAITEIESTGTNAAPLVPLLVELLEDADPQVGLRSIRALRQIGPVAPDSLPRLISAMPNMSLHPFLVPLLGAYGPLASNAVPDLETLVAGHSRPRWTNQESLPQGAYQYFLAERYGLRPGLQAKASDSLAKRYGLSPTAPAPGTNAAFKIRANPPDVPLELQLQAWKALRQIQPEVNRPMPEHVRDYQKFLEERYGIAPSK